MSPWSPESLTRRLLTPARGVFLGALLLRLWVLWQATGVPYFFPDQGDMKFYSDWARRIAGGTWTDHQAFYGLPGYAYWLAGIYKLVGFQPYAAVLLQTVAEALTATIIFQMGILVFGSRLGPRGALAVGVAAAVGWVFFIPAQAFSVILMPTAFLVLTFWFIVWRVLARGTAPWRPGVALGTGALMGAVAMMVANILFLVPFVLASIGMNNGLRARRWGAAGAAAGLLLGGVILGASPCALHNYLVAGEPVFLSAHSGLNFYVGNHPDANGYPKLPPGLRADQEGMLRDSITWAERAVGRPLKRVEVSAFWSAKAKAYISEHPGAWARLLLVKLRNVFNGFSYDDLSIVAQLREDGVLLPGLTFGFVALLGLPGLALAAREVGGARWLAAAVALHAGSLLTVFVTERYRMACAPGLLLGAGYGLWRVVEMLRVTRPITAGVAPLAGYAVALAASATLVFWPQRDPSLLGLDEYNTALADLAAGRPERAQTKLEHVLVGNPYSTEPHFALGNVLLAQGDRTGAKECYRRTLQLDPTHRRVLNNLGVLALQEGRWALAEQFLDVALRMEASDANTLYLLAQARWREGHLADAADAVDRALALRPTQARLQELRTQILAGGTPPDLHLE